MIDFIKLNKRLSEAEVRSLRDSIDFYSTFNTATGEEVSLSPNGKHLLSHLLAWDRNMKIKLYSSGWCEVSGSIHKYFNDGKHNFNQFSKKDLINTLRLMEDKLDLDLMEFKISGLEFGVNIQPPISSEDIIDYSLMYKGRSFESKYHNDEGNYKQVELCQYKVKLYDKRLHYEAQGYEVGNETLRFELKYNVMKSINCLGIYHLRDLIERIDCLKEPLLNAWDNILLFDPTINKNVKEEKKLKYNNIKFWNDISKKNKRSYLYHLKKLKEITENNSCGIQAQVRDIMKERLDALV